MMDNDLIRRGLAISYAVSGRVRRIDGEDWIRTSEVRQSLNDVPTVEPEKEIVPVCKVIFDKDQLQEIVDKRIAEMVERPRDELVRKEDITQYIATQYSEHNELVPTWLKIGDLKGSEE